VRISSQRNLLQGFSRWFWRLDSWIANSRMTDIMVAVSQQTRRFCIQKENIRPEKLLVIPNGVDVAGYESQRILAVKKGGRLSLPDAGPETLVVLTVARLHPQKGHVILLQAVKSLVAQFRDIIFWWVGDGPERENLEGLIRQADLESCVFLLGARNDVSQLLAQADLFVLPSLYEGMPNAVLEAMATGLPVVATNAGGTAEIISHGETGLLVPANDAPGLAAALRLMLADKDIRSIIGKKAQEYVRANFSAQKMCACYERLIQNMMGKHCPSKSDIEES
jgi:glycosyltransferase involved in cell wall biosynthesis